MTELVAAGFLLLIGFGLLIAGVADLVYSLWRWYGSNFVSGTVVSNVSEDCCYFPKIEVALSDGARVTFTSKIGCGKPEYSIGDEVRIALNESDPGRSEIASLRRLMLTPVSMVLLSVPFIVFNGLWW